jgi:hypothetical protein
MNWTELAETAQNTSVRSFITTMFNLPLSLLIWMAWLTQPDFLDYILPQGTAQHTGLLVVAIIDTAVAFLSLAAAVYLYAKSRRAVDELIRRCSQGSTEQINPVPSVVMDKIVPGQPH